MQILWLSCLCLGTLNKDLRINIVKNTKLLLLDYWCQQLYFKTKETQRVKLMPPVPSVVFLSGQNVIIEIWSASKR